MRAFNWNKICFSWCLSEGDNSCPDKQELQKRFVCEIVSYVCGQKFAPEITLCFQWLVQDLYNLWLLYLVSSDSVGKAYFRLEAGMISITCSLFGLFLGSSCCLGKVVIVKVVSAAWSQDCATRAKLNVSLGIFASSGCTNDTVRGIGGDDVGNVADALIIEV